MRWSVLSVIAVGCAGGPRAAPGTPEPGVSEADEPAEPRELAVAEAPPRPPREQGERRRPDPSDLRSGLRDRRELGIDVLIAPEQLIPRRGPAEGVADSDLWDRCVRELVLAQPEPARRALGAMFNRYLTECDHDGRVALIRPLGPDGRERRAQSDVAFAGTLSPQRSELVLRVTSCGGSADPDRITIVADDLRWTSSRLEFTKDDHECASAELPVTRALVRAVRGLIDARAGEAAIRFDGAHRYDVVTLDDDARRDLQIVLDAVDALERRP